MVVTGNHVHVGHTSDEIQQVPYYGYNYNGKVNFGPQIRESMSQ